MQITITISPVELYELMVLTNKTIPNAGLGELVVQVDEEPATEEAAPATEQAAPATEQAAPATAAPATEPAKAKRRSKAEMEAAKAAAAAQLEVEDEPEGLNEGKVRAAMARAMVNDPGRANKVLLGFGPSFSAIPTDKWEALMEALTWS